MHETLFIVYLCEQERERERERKRDLVSLSGSVAVEEVTCNRKSIDIDDVTLCAA